MKKIFLIDLMNVAMRSYHALQRHGLSHNGQMTYMTFGVATALNKLIESYNPDYLVICTDTKGHTFRHEMYAPYKSNRKPADPEFAAQLPDLFRMLEAYGFKVARRDATEADDILGTLATRWASDENHVYVVSGDKDMMQLITPQVSVCRPMEGLYVVNGRVECIEKFGNPPESIVDMLALMGDAVDCVPGVKGVGAKTAEALIKSFGSVEQIYESIDLVKGSVAKKLIEDKDMAFLSKKLVTIDRNIPIDLNLEDCKVEPGVLRRPELLAFYGEMGFDSLLIPDPGFDAPMVAFADSL